MGRTKVVMLVLSEMRYDARVHREADALGRAGFDVVVFGLYDGTGPLAEDAANYRIRRIRVSTRPLLPSRASFHLVKYIEFVSRACSMAALENADIYHAHDLNALVPLGLVAQFKDRPLVYDAHELWCERPGTPLLPLWRKLEGSFMRRAVLLIAPSPERLEHLVQSYEFRGSRLVVRNCPPYREIERNSALLDYARSHNPRVRYIALLHGRIGQVKIPELAIGALCSCQDRVGLVFVGPVESDYQNHLMSLAENLGVGDRTFFHPAVPHERLLDLVASADLGLVLYKPDGLQYLYCAPNKYYECLMAGTPMIGNDLPCLHSLIEQNDVGIVCATDAGAVGQAIDSVVSRPRVRQDMQDNALSLAKHQLNWQLEQQNFLRAYGSLR